MKNTILIMIVATITLIGTQAFACYWDGYYGDPMDRYWANTFSGSGYQNFQKDTAQIQQQLTSKKAEYNALMAAPEPDLTKAAALNDEIMALYDQLVTQAGSYNLPTPPMNPGYGVGRRGGYGRPW